VFDSIEPSAQEDVFCSSLSDFGEVMWFYPSGTSTQMDKQVTYNYQENSWHVGTLARSAWTDRTVYDYPHATEFSATDTTTAIPTAYGVTAGRTFVYQQEYGKNDDGSAITAYVESGDMDIADGDQFMSMSRFIPDFKNQSGNVDVTIKTRPYPSGTQTSHGSYAISTSTKKQDTRIRGRQLAVRIASDAVDEDWRYGTIRLELRPDGTRGA